MSFKPSSFLPGLIPRPELMMVPPIFMTDYYVGPSKRSIGFSGSLQWYGYVFVVVLYITLIKLDLPIPPLSEKNMCAGSTSCR